MPEGHTLHRLAGSLNHAFAGTAPLASSPQGRFVEGAALLSGRPFLEAFAWGKHLFCSYAEDVFLHVHLGLIGSFDVREPASGASRFGRSSNEHWPLERPGERRGLDRRVERGTSERGGKPASGASRFGRSSNEHWPPEPVGAVRLRLVNAAYLADLRGATHVAIATPEEVDSVIARLGPDPLRPLDSHNDPERAWKRISKSPRSIADLLMDQAVLAGVGNVYRSEILFRHRVDPHRPGREIRRQTWEALWADVVLLLPIGVRLGQIVTMADQVEDILAGEVDEALAPDAASGVSAWRPNPLAGAVERRYYVYKRQGEPCRVCGSRIRTEVVAGRNLFWCGRCQRRR